MRTDVTDLPLQVQLSTAHTMLSSKDVWLINFTANKFLNDHILNIYLSINIKYFYELTLLRKAALCCPHFNTKY